LKLMDIDGVMIHDALGTTPPACTWVNDLIVLVVRWGRTPVHGPLTIPPIIDHPTDHHHHHEKIPAFVSYHTLPWIVSRNFCHLFRMLLRVLGCSQTRNVSSFLEQTARSMTNNRFALAGQWKNGMLNRVSAVKSC
jgi:hypothetical protein